MAVQSLISDHTTRDPSIDQGPLLQSQSAVQHWAAKGQHYWLSIQSAKSLLSRIRGSKKEAHSRVFSVVVHKLMQTHFQSFHRTFGKRNVNFLYQRHESPILCSKIQKKGHKQIRRADVCSTAENGPDNLTQSQIRTIQTILEHYLTK